jgi:hypothetical protein
MMMILLLGERAHPMVESRVDDDEKDGFLVGGCGLTHNMKMAEQQEQ